MVLHGFREWFAGRKGRMFLPLVLAVAAAGCGSGFRETHFFRSESGPNGIPNYFRLVISGQTMFVSSRYVSGYFEEDTVNQYFNEISQPDKARLIPVGQSSKPGETKPGETKPSDGKNGVAPATSSKPTQELKNATLVLLLSSNSDDIANQIGALAQSQEFTASLARLVASPRFEAADEAERRLRNDQARGRTLAVSGDELIGKMPNKPSPDQVNNRLLEFVNQLAADLGAAGSFKDLNEAYTWFNNHRVHLRQEGHP